MTKPKKRKKTRSAAQKRATKKMIAAGLRNRAARRQKTEYTKASGGYELHPVTDRAYGKHRLQKIGGRLYSK